MGLGVLRLSPAEFRAMSLGEFMLAMDGVAMANGTYQKNTLTWNDVLEADAEWQRRSSKN